MMMHGQTGEFISKHYFIQGYVKYVAFAPFDALSFNPDILIVVATKADKIIRAASYTVENVAKQRDRCDWLFMDVYPPVLKRRIKPNDHRTLSRHDCKASIPGGALPTFYSP